MYAVRRPAARLQQATLARSERGTVPAALAQPRPVTQPAHTRHSLRLLAGVNADLERCRPPPCILQVSRGLPPDHFTEQPSTSSTAAAQANKLSNDTQAAVARFSCFGPAILLLLHCQPAAALTEAATMPGSALLPFIGIAAAGSAMMLLIKSIQIQARRVSSMLTRLQQPSRNASPRRRTRSRPSSATRSVDGQDSGQPHALLVPSITGTTQKHLQSYIPHTLGNNPHNPAVIAVRNQALATAASYSVHVAIKDSRPHIRQLLQQLRAQAATDSPGCTPQLLNSSIASSRHGALHKRGGSSSGVQDPEAAVLHVALLQLRRLEEAHGPIAWRDMDEPAMDALQQRLVKAVAEHAALEQFHAIVSVVAAEQERGGWPGVFPGNRWWPGGAKRQGKRPKQGGSDIRGGGAL